MPVYGLTESRRFSHSHCRDEGKAM